MELNYILSPIKAGSRVLKSRLIHSTSYNLKGPGPQDPTDVMFAKAQRYFTAVSDAGAALVCISNAGFPDQQTGALGMSTLDCTVPEIRDGFRRLIEAVHERDTLCIANFAVESQEYNISHLDDWEEKVRFHGDYAEQGFFNKPEYPLELLEKLPEQYARQADALRGLGFDGVSFHMSYCSSVMCNALSALFNRRTDRYGGSDLKQRARLPLEILSAVRDACGSDFLIQIQMSPFQEAPGYTVEEWLEFCELAQDLCDIIQIRGYDGSYTHVTGFNSSKERPFALPYAEMLKQRGIRALTAPVGGFDSPIEIDRFIAEGKTDLVAMARGWIADLDYAKKIREGRPEDVRPCLGCMKNCQFPSCAVNPDYGAVIDPALLSAPGSPKKVAVVGGGPAGIRAAMMAAGRGHCVTLYERSGNLGGQLRFAPYPTFKWRINEYLKWLCAQLQKSPVEVRMNTEATPEALKAEHYDIVILALGSTPKLPPIKGADQVPSWNVDNIWGHEQELGRRVVVVGGGSSSREAALYLANCGHQVTMLTRKQEVFTDDSHCIWGEVEQYLKEKNLKVVHYAATTEIQDGCVVCTVRDIPLKKLTFFTVGARLAAEAKRKPLKLPGFLYPEYPSGQHHRMPPDDTPQGEYPTHEERFSYDSLILSGGRSVPEEELKKFQQAADQIYVIGDAVVPGSIHEASLTAYAAANSF